MAITINNILTQHSATSPVTETAYAPSAGSDAKLVVCVLTERTASGAITFTATYDGNSLTAATAVAQEQFQACQIFYIDDPLALSTPNGDVVATCAGTGTVNGISIVTATLLGVASGAPDGSDTDNGDGANQMNLTMTPAAAGSIILSCLTDGNGFTGYAPVGPHVEHIDENGGGSTMRVVAGSYESYAASSQTITWDRDSGTHRLAAAGAAWQPPGTAAIAPGGVLSQPMRIRQEVVGY
jgi:hypothetical protein